MARGITAKEAPAGDLAGIEQYRGQPLNAAAETSALTNYLWQPAAIGTRIALLSRENFPLRTFSPL